MVAFLMSGKYFTLSTVIQKTIRRYIDNTFAMMSSGGNRMERPTKFCAENNMIVVRPTYRLGALGWVHFGLISDQLPEAVNLGLQDQILALQWIHDNIEFFGGDRDNLTIGGESCGATISCLRTIT
ncbi:Para-nitrobenzyl esterase [Penicillium rolfsii]|nr:Para-nitrobenzyl esterase [Penicillium rolfsii]